MNKFSLICSIFILFCFYHISSAQESEKCECDILQLKRSGLITNYTKQSGEINGRPFYFSIKADQEYFWWNDIARSWMFQTKSSSLKVQDIDCQKLSKDWTEVARFFELRCLMDEMSWMDKCHGEFDEKSVIFFKHDIIIQSKVWKKDTLN